MHNNGICPYASSTATQKRTKTTTTATSQETKPVNIDATEIKIKEDINNIKIGENKKLEATIEPNNATDKTITWKTRDESIATISNTGEITGKKEGTAEITASSSNGKTSTIKINVEKEKI